MVELVIAHILESRKVVLAGVMLIVTKTKVKTL